MSDLFGRASNGVEVSLSIDFEGRETYERLIGAAAMPTFTVVQTVDLNPYHRQAKGLRRRGRKAWDCARWTARGLLRMPRAEKYEITLPNVRFEAQS